MLTGVHILLTYRCTKECDHCFVFGSPWAVGTFTADQVRRLLGQIEGLRGVETVFFEGGEPFLFYGLMREGVRLVRAMGFEPGIVTNAYWATSPGDAELWLRPLRELGLSSLCVSDGSLYHGPEEQALAPNAAAACEALGMGCTVMTTDRPAVEDDSGGPSVTGGVMFRGRATEKLTDGLPRQPWQHFTECPFEDLADPRRVHVDACGHVHLCQGVSMGNVWEKPLADLAAGYEPGSHPICGPLLDGGPAELAARYEVEHKDAYVDACHLCYAVRRELLDRFPGHLAPAQVYGLT